MERRQGCIVGAYSSVGAHLPAGRQAAVRPYTPSKQHFILAADYDTMGLEIIINMPRREINPIHDASTDIKMTERMRRPLETSYNDEGAEQGPQFDIPAEGADPESLLTSETPAEADVENVDEKLYQAQETDRHSRFVRRAAEAVAGWSPRKNKIVVKEPNLGKESLEPLLESELRVVLKKRELREELRAKKSKLLVVEKEDKSRIEKTDYWPILEKAAEEFALASLLGTKKKDKDEREIDYTPEERAEHHQAALGMIKDAAGLFESLVEARKVARGVTWRLGGEEKKVFTDKLLSAVGLELKRRSQRQRELKADLSGRDRPLVEVEPAEAGEELSKQESIGHGEVNKHPREMVRRYNEGRHEEKFVKHRQADKEKTRRLGQRQKIAEVLDARMEAGVPKGAAEDAAIRRLRDFFDAHQDYLGDSFAGLTNEEQFRYGRFTALDFFDFVDDFKNVPNFPALVKAARSGLQARLERDSDLAEHFLRMVKRNEKARESIPGLDELEKIALERVKKPLSLPEQGALGKRYGLVIQEKDEKAAQKGWDEEGLSRQSYFDRGEALTKKAYKYEKEKKLAKKYSVQQRSKSEPENHPNP